MDAKYHKAANVVSGCKANLDGRCGARISSKIRRLKMLERIERAG